MKNLCVTTIAGLALAMIGGGMAGDWPYPCRTLGLCATANAEEKPATKELTVQEALEVLSGLRSLVQPFPTTDKDGKQVTGYNKFNSDFRILIAVNIDVGVKVERVMMSAQDTLVSTMSGGAGTVPESARGTFSVELRKLQDQPCRCSFYRIKKEDLRLDDNPQILGALAPLIPIMDR